MDYGTNDIKALKDPCPKSSTGERHDWRWDNEKNPEGPVQDCRHFVCARCGAAWEVYVPEVHTPQRRLSFNFP